MNVVELVKKSIKKNEPLQFLYTSKHSDKFKGEEKTPHLRTVQPVVIGRKITKEGVKTYFRGYLLGHYSYSQNASFGGDTDSNQDMEYWRVYDIAKVQNPKIVPNYVFRFYPQNHREYNPADKFFNSIIMSMPKSIKRKDKKESIIDQLEMEIITEFIDVPFTLYHTSENEEMAYIENGQLFINGVWVTQSSYEKLNEGLNKIKLEFIGA